MWSHVGHPIVNDKIPPGSGTDKSIPHGGEEVKGQARQGDRMAMPRSGDAPALPEGSPAPVRLTQIIRDLAEAVRIPIWQGF